MRRCGILLHITSLPGAGGVGSLGREAYDFVDFLADAGQSYWQVLPLTPPAKGNSPYSAYSVFAGNPALINLEQLEREGLLAFWSRKFLPKHHGEPAKYEYIERVHLPMLRQAFRNASRKSMEALARFQQEHTYWLDDYALFMTILHHQNFLPFSQWPQPLKQRNPQAIQEIRENFAEDIQFWRWVQMIFFRQWKNLRRYASKKGIQIIGDMPLYPAMDSADVWAHPEVFQLDGQGNALRVAGCPPDDFAKDGQLWGNPLYAWERLKADHYSWWKMRLQLAANVYDAVRIDHFRGLDAYYAIPADAETAREGAWQPGPGLDFVQAMQQHLPDCALIAEDLGEMTDSARQLLIDSGLPGMRVLQFGFSSEDSEHLPHNYPKHCVAYSGTHDNNTIIGWLHGASPEERRYAREYLHLAAREGEHWGVIRALYASAADTVILPMQDILGLDERARMNIPGVAGGQWAWRLDGRLLTKRLSTRLREKAKLYSRMAKA